MRCLELAKNGLGNTYPNPMVGCVIVRNHKIISEAWHHKAGEPHAEANAINSVKNPSLLKEVTLYVSLEPCSHYGKTPPCSELIISTGIKKVVIGSIDPFAQVCGKGVQQLMSAGVDVTLGVLETECKFLNRRFFTFHRKKRPYIILKWAETQDGFIAPNVQPERHPVWITSSESKQLVHKWRSEEAAILVGTNTVLADNPQLNVRLWDTIAEKNPIRLVLDKTLKIPQKSKVFDGKTKTLVFCENPLENKGKIVYKKINFNENLPEQICDILFENELQSVIVEGGAKTLQSFIDANLWDEARVFTGNRRFHKGTERPSFSGKLTESKQIGKDELKIYHND